MLTFLMTLHLVKFSTYHERYVGVINYKNCWNLLRSSFVVAPSCKYKVKWWTLLKNNTNVIIIIFSALVSIPLHLKFPCECSTCSKSFRTPWKVTPSSSSFIIILFYPCMIILDFLIIFYFFYLCFNASCEGT